MSYLNEPLKPCPECKSKKISVKTIIGRNIVSDKYYYKCECGCKTKIFATQYKADAAWQRGECKK